MIETLTIESFKSIQSVTLELGQVNVFIGANGSGKSNLLEALAVLSAAASGKVDQSTLMWRGCRASSYYRPMFEGYTDHNETHFRAVGKDVSYEVALSPPPSHRALSWDYLSEQWEYDGQLKVNRPAVDGHYTDAQVGFAALKLADTSPDHHASIFLKTLAAYSVYEGNKAVLQGKVIDSQDREPVGLGGGRLAEAVLDLSDDRSLGLLGNDLSACVNWFNGFDLATNRHGPAEISFSDRYFNEEDQLRPLTTNDVNEGVLYLTFLGVLGLHRHAPRLLAIENVDQGLNPLFARHLMSTLTERILSAEPKRQVFLTTHNPLVLDGLPLGDDRVRLFTVDRDNKGHTVVQRIDLDRALKARPNDEWTLSRMWVNGLIGGVPDV